MATNPEEKITVSTNGTAMFSIRPCLMLMLVRIRSAAATLELSLAEIKQRSTETTQRLLRLGAKSVDLGEPHEDEGAETDPMARMRATMRPRLPRTAETALPERPGVNTMLTAAWDISGMSAEDVLLLVDQLRFDAASHTDTPQSVVPASPSWEDPEEHLRNMLAQLQEPPKADLAPQFLYISRPREEQLAKATAEAFEAAKQMAERLAAASGRQLAQLSSVNCHRSPGDARPDRYQGRQKCDLMLAASSYALRDGELVSLDARTIEVDVTVHATHQIN